MFNQSCLKSFEGTKVMGIYVHYLYTIGIEVYDIAEIKILAKLINYKSCGT